MTRYVFKTESRRTGRCAAWAAAAVCLYLAVSYLVSVFLPDAARLGAARNAYWFLLIASYAVPPVLLITVIYGERFRYFEAAGVRRSEMTAGRVFALFVWTAAFILVELLAATVYDTLLFAGKEVVRNQLQQKYFLFSLVSHGAGRLLFAPSVAVTMLVAYLTYGALKRAVVIPRTAAAKLLAVAFVGVLVFLCQYAAFVYLSNLTLNLDFNFATAFDTLFPIHPALKIDMPVDAVRDYHLYAAPILNLLYLLPQAAYVLTAWAYIVLGGKRDV